MRILVGAVLAVSLAANAFLAGWLVSAESRPAAVQRGGERAGPLRSMIRELRALPASEREPALAVIREYRPRLRERARALRAARAEMGALLTAEDFSRARAEAQFAKVREASTALQALAQTMTLDLADRLPAETRAALIGNPRPGR